MTAETPAVGGLVQLALEKMKRDHAAGARGDLETALRRAPGDPWVLSTYGLCLAQLGHLGEGLGLCERALLARPDEVELRVNLGKAYRLVGDNGAAHRSFLRAWQTDRRHPAPAAELARMGIRRSPVLSFLPRSHWCNRVLGRLRVGLERTLGSATGGWE